MLPLLISHYNSIQVFEEELALGFTLLSSNLVQCCGCYAFGVLFGCPSL
jgi:hypothetical protein